MPLAGHHTQVLVGGFDLTADTQRVMIADGCEAIDVTTMGDISHKFVPGKHTHTIQHMGYMDVTDAKRSHTVLKGILPPTESVSVLLGNNAAPVTSDIAYSIAVAQGGYQVSPEVGKSIPFTARFANRGVVGGWGFVVAPPVSQLLGASKTATTYVDLVGTYTGRGAAFLHILTPIPVGTTYNFILQGSSTSGFGSPTALVTIPVGNASGGDFQPDSIAIATAGGILLPQYVRWQVNRSAGVDQNVTFAMTYVIQR